MKSNTRFNKNTKGVECLNCKQPIANVDNFCSNCGQVNDTKRLSLKQYITELLGGLFAFDTRTLNTLQPLLFSPGKVSQNYINGKRVKYVNPFKLYLHTSIVFFLIMSIINVVNDYSDIQSETTEQPVLKSDGESISFNIGSNKNEEELKKVKINDVEVNKKITKSIDSIVNSDEFKNTLILSKTGDTSLVNFVFINEMKELHNKINKEYYFINDSLSNYNNFRKKYINTLEKNAQINQIDFRVSDELYIDSDKSLYKWLFGKLFYKKINSFENSKTKNISKALDSLGYKRTRSNIFLFKKVREFKNEDVFTSKLISKSSITLFLMLPLFTLFLWFFYIRHNINYTEHLIFVFNTQIVFFIILLLFLILNRILDYKFGAIIIMITSVFLIIKHFKAINNFEYHNQKITVLFLYFMFAFYIVDKAYDLSFGVLIFIVLFSLYLYKAMRTFYKQSRIKTITKFIILNSIFFFLMIIGSAITMFLAFII